MTYKTAFIGMAPEGDPKKHRATIKTPKVEFTAVMVGLMDYEQAVDVCKELLQGEGIQSITLCPAFTHAEVARVVDAVGKGVAVNVCRGDFPGTMREYEAVKKEGWFTK